MKKEGSDKKIISNRLLYTFIFLGISLLILGGVYAINPTTDAYHDVSMVNFNTGFTVNGDITANAFYYSSDLSLKKEIQQLQSPLDLISQLKGVSFYWKSNNKKDMGLIAQDVEKVLPELVHTNEEGLKSVEYGNLVALLIEAVKEQQKEILELQTEVKELKAQLN